MPSSGFRRERCAPRRLVMAHDVLIGCSLKAERQGVANRQKSSFLAKPATSFRSRVPCACKCLRSSCSSIVVSLETRVLAKSLVSELDQLRKTTSSAARTPEDQLVRSFGVAPAVVRCLSLRTYSNLHASVVVPSTPHRADCGSHTATLHHAWRHAALDSRSAVHACRDTTQKHLQSCSLGLKRVLVHERILSYGRTKAPARRAPGEQALGPLAAAAVTRRASTAAGA